MTLPVENQPIRGNITRGRERLLSFPRCRVYRNGGLSIATGTTTTLIWDALDADETTEAMWNSANPTRLTCITAGGWRIQADAQWAISATGIRVLTLTKTTPAGTVVYPNSQISANAGGFTDPQSRSWRVSMNAGDYVELGVVQNSGGPLAFNAATLTSRINGLDACLLTLP